MFMYFPIPNRTKRSWKSNTKRKYIYIYAAQTIFKIILHKSAIECKKRWIASSRRVYNISKYARCYRAQEISFPVILFWTENRCLS